MSANFFRKYIDILNESAPIQEKTITENFDRKKVKSFISDWDDNYYPNPARPEWNLKGVNSLGILTHDTPNRPGLDPYYSGFVDGIKKGYWTLKTTPAKREGDIYMIQVKNPEYFELFLRTAYEKDPNMELYVNEAW